MADMIWLPRPVDDDIGRQQENPFKFFPAPAGAVEVAPEELLKMPPLGHICIIGGETHYCEEAYKQLHARRLLGQQFFLWGAGVNTLDQPLHRMTLDRMSEWYGQIDLVGVRDWNTGMPWVPCPSCMSPLFDKAYKVDHEYVVYSHYKRPLFEHVKAMPRMVNRGATFEEAVSFLASGSCVLTNSYHGAYWATLLQRKVVIVFPFSSRFMYLRHAHPICTSGWYGECLKHAILYPNALKECREANVAHHEQVLALLKTPSSR